MEYLKRIGSLQIAIVAGCTVLIGSAMLSHGNQLGLAFVGLAAICVIAGLLKGKAS